MAAPDNHTEAEAWHPERHGVDALARSIHVRRPDTTLWPSTGRPGRPVTDALAQGLLTRRPDVVGVVAHGEKRGRELGFPTANLHVPGLRRRDGVYGGLVVLAGGSRHLAAISIGTRPTYWGKYGVRLLEAHLIDFSGDLYGSRLKVWLSSRLRGQVAFTSESLLIAQMDVDVQLVKSAAHTLRSGSSA